MVETWMITDREEAGKQENFEFRISNFPTGSEACWSPGEQRLYKRQQTDQQGQAHLNRSSET
jgi:hypothetical protein